MLSLLAELLEGIVVFIARLLAESPLAYVLDWLLLALVRIVRAVWFILGFNSSFRRVK